MGSKGYKPHSNNLDYDMSIEAMKKMVEAVEADLKLFNIPHTARMLEALNAGRTAIEQAEKQPCNYPNCPYPCPDLPDCKDEDLYDLAKQADNGGQP